MDEKIIFTEQQRFKQWWLWLILIALNGIFIYGIYEQVVQKKQFGDNPTSDIGLFVALGVMLLLSLLFYTMKLQTTIKSDGIYVRFFPFHIAYKKYGWNELTKIYVRQYSPITEYGGWGIRLGLFGKGNAFNVSGDQGLQLEMTNHRKLLIGTNKPEALKTVLEEIGHYQA